MRRKEFGDFQTPLELAQQILQVMQRDFDTNWSRLLEPTCGHGNFIRAALDSSCHFDEIIGIEIQAEYAQRARQIPTNSTRLEIIQSNIFTFDSRALNWHTDGNLLILGNPPWITNAELSALDSTNIPLKSNFKHLSGLDALTGKSNFDVTEYIWIKLLHEMQQQTATFALLCKTAVARKVLTYAQQQRLPIVDARLYRINSQQWFGAAVDACLFSLSLADDTPDYTAKVYAGLNAVEPEQTWGFVSGRLVSDIATFRRLSHVYRVSPLEWRQGIKHDAASVMELVRTDSGWINKQGNHVDVEDEFRYPLLKSSDIQHGSQRAMTKAVIIPQRTIGEDTLRLAQIAPRLWHYLKQHEALFLSRKSSIYKNKPPFSIFGVGDYSFAPYKVIVSGFYKVPFFLSVGSVAGQPMMCDDTAYLLPCETALQAALISALLNHPETIQFIKSLMFSDSKRPITKSLLQTIDLVALLHHLPLTDIRRDTQRLLQQMPAEKQAAIPGTTAELLRVLLPKNHQPLLL